MKAFAALPLSLSLSRIILYFCDCELSERRERKTKKRSWLEAESIPLPHTHTHYSFFSIKVCFFCSDSRREATSVYGLWISEKQSFSSGLTHSVSLSKSICEIPKDCKRLCLRQHEYRWSVNRRFSQQKRVRSD